MVTRRLSHVVRKYELRADFAEATVVNEAVCL